MRAQLLRATPLAGWAVLAVLGLVLVDVWAGPPQAYPVLVVALAPWLLFAAWPIAAVALFARRWPLAVAGLAIVLVQGLVLLPSFAPWHAPAAAVPGTTFTVLDANVKWDNGNLAGIGRQILADKPDLVTLEELSYFNLPSLMGSGVLQGYGYSELLPTYDARGYGVWSKLPLTEVRSLEVGGLPMVAATVSAPRGPIALLVVHTISADAGSASWSREMHALAAYAAARRGQALLLVGDFNATVAMRQMRQLLDAGVQDAADANGAGREMTWAANGRTIVPIMRIDHVLYTKALTTSGYRLGQASGSEHRPILLTVGRRA